MMHLLALENSCPPHAFSQQDVWNLLDGHPAAARLRDGSRHLLRKILLGQSGIGTRYFCAEDPRLLFAADAQTLNGQFEREAPLLGARALTGALEKAGLRAGDLDALFVCTCTGYLCPGLSSYVAERVGLKPEAYLLDIVGQGCGAAVPTLRAVSHFLAAHPGAKAACLAVEVCSAAFFLDDDPGVLVSLCLFGDGASASIWAGTEGGPFCGGFDTILLPGEREKLRFTNHEGRLRNLLHADVPGLAAETVETLYRRIGGTPPTRLASHPGGKKVIEAIGEKLPEVDLSAATAVLEKYGNMSSPSVLFALEHALREAAPGEEIWLTSFGAGVSCHGCTIRA